MLEVRKLDNTNKSSIINLCLKPLSMILGLIYTPMLLEYLGMKKYGLWTTILSIISWINYCDVGVGQGLRNLLSKEFSDGQRNEARSSISTAYVVLTIISMIILIFSSMSIWIIDTKDLFKTDIDMRFPLEISFIFICINFVLSLSNTLLFSLQKSEYVAVKNCLVQLLNICGLLFLNRNSNRNGSLVLMSVLFGFTSMILHLGNTIHIFFNNSDILPRIKLFNKNKICEICNVGIKFFIIQIACIALYTVDNLLITNLFGSEQVTPFNIVYKAFNTVYGFLAALIVPYWSKTTVALHKRDFRWINKAIVRLNIIAVIFCVGYIILCLLFKPLANLWLGQKLDYPKGLILTMCIYYCFYSVVVVNTQIINGTGKINGQLIIMILMGLLNIPLSIYLAKDCGFGVVGVRLATTILMAVAAVYFPINLLVIIKHLKVKSSL